MSNRKFTPTQQAAIEHRGHNILVSASAGSGKTTVLVERVIQEILGGTNVDQLLVVTFTEAAASEMRQRIQAALQERSQTVQDPALKQRLRQQLSLVPTAQISTLHAFCLRVIKRFYYVIKLDPAFRLLSDEAERLLIADRVWQQVREDYYAQNDTLFYELAQNFSNDRNDDGLTEIVFDLFNFANANPDADRWLNDLATPYEVPASGLTMSPYFQTVILPILQQTLKNARTNLQTAQQLVPESEKFEVYLPMITANLAGIQTILSTELTWTQWRAHLNELQLGPLTRTKKLTPEEQPVKDELKANLDQAKQLLQQLLDCYFIFDETQTTTIQQQSGHLVEKLVEVTQTFKRAFQAEKKRRHLLDFSDLEHDCLAILTGSSAQALAARQFYQAKFSEILVDEYQDTNQLQETIIQTVASTDPANVFMVGDVKQSIYAFRLADPSLFIHKYREFGEQTTAGERIILAENFRSRRNIDDFVNLVFTQLMDVKLGQLAYDENAQLQYGATYYPEAELTAPTELLLYEAKPVAPQKNTLTKTEGQIALVAQRLKKMVTDKELIYDRHTEEMRPVEYRDIVLLTPTRTNNLVILDYFQRYGLPIVINDAQNYFQTTEVQIMLSLLEIIDNPNQDIPLVSVLRSPIVGLKENELALIRINQKTGDYYQAVFKFIQSYNANKAGKIAQKVLPKLTHFTDLLARLRGVARKQSLATLIWTIYQETGYLDYVGGMPAGKQRQANLHALYERATSYENNGFKGLFQFIQFIQRLQKQDKDLAQPTSLSTPDAISVMTIHKSKGLEFPVVVLMNAEHQFNEQDLQQNYVLDDHAGLGMAYLAPQERIRIPTLPDLAITALKRQKLRAEELRKLYVALTRAEQRLLIAGSCDNQEQLFKTWQVGLNSSEQSLDIGVRQTANNLLTWLGLALIRHPQMSAWFDNQPVNRIFADDSTEFTLQFADEVQLGTIPGTLQKDTDWVTQQQVASKAITLTNTTGEMIQQMLAFQYPEQVATTTTAYQSVSEVKRLFEDPDNLNLGQVAFPDGQPKQRHRYLDNELTTPQFMQTTHVPTAPEIGTATHLVLQELDLTQPVTLQGVEQLIAQLTAQKLITTTVAPLINREHLLNFFNSDLGQALLAHPEAVHREVPFSLLLPAQQLFTDFTQTNRDPVLIHGIMDGYLQTEAGYLLYDFKTDFVNPAHIEESIDKIKQRYRGQVKLYAAALAQIGQKPVLHQYLYLLAIGQLIEIV